MSSTYTFANVAAERSYYARLDAERRQRNLQRQQANDRMARLVGDLHRTYPHMEPGVVLALAQSGVRPGSEQADEIAQLSGQREADDDSGGNLFTDALGKVATPFKALGRGASEVADVIDDPLKGAVRTTFTLLDAPFREIQGRVGDIVTGGGEVLAGAGTVLGAGVGAVGGTLLAPGAGTTAGAVIGGSAGAALGGAVGGFLGDIAGGGETRVFSEAGLATQDILAGRPVDLGSGFFPGGEVHERQAEQMREIGQKAGLGNRGFTIGRYFANEVSEPGTVPFSVLSGVLDAGMMVYSDPSATGLGAYSKWAKGRKLLRPEDRVALSELGLVDDVRKTVLPEKVHPWLFSDEAKPIREYLAGEKNFERLRRNTGHKIPTEIMVDLLDASSVDEVDGILAPIFGTVVREKLPVPAAVRGGRFGTAKQSVAEGALTFGKPTYEIRAISKIPGRVLDNRDPEGAIETLNRYLLNAKVPEAQRAERLEELARAYVDDNPGAVFETVFRRSMKDVEDSLVEFGVPKSKARELTRIKGDAVNIESRYWHDRTGENARFATPLAEDIGVEATDPHLISELLNSTIELPDFREIRRQATKFRRILTHPTVKIPRAVGDMLTTAIWKPLTLLTRLAYPARVIPEELGRMSGAGLNSMFRHPLSYISLALSDHADALGRRLDDAPVGALTEWQQAMIRDRSGWVGQPVGTSFKGATLVDPEDVDEYVDAWAGLIAKYASDEVLPKIADGGTWTDDALKEWFFAGDGKKFREFLMENPAHGNLELREVSDLWVDSYRQRLMHDTLEDPRLLEVIATGKLPSETDEIVGRTVRAADRGNVGKVVDDRGDTALVKFRNKAEGTAAEVELPKADLEILDDDQVLRAFAGEKQLDIHPRLKEFLREKVERGEVPGQLPGDMWVSRGGELSDFYNRATDRMFSMLMAAPANKLTRSSTFEQFYWNRVGELMPTLSSADQARIIDNAVESGLPKRMLRELRDAAKKGGDASLAADDVDTLAKGFALDETKQLLFDMSEKGQFFDALQVVFPFGDAWMEVITRWARIIRENPKVLRRVQQGIGNPTLPGEIRDEDGQLIVGAGVEVFTPEGDRLVGEVAGETGDGNVRVRTDDGEVVTVPESDVRGLARGGSGLRGTGVGEVLGEIPGLSETYGPGRGFFYTNENGQEVFGYPFTGALFKAVAGQPIPMEGRLAGLNLMGEVLPGVGPVVQFPAAYLIDNQPEWNGMREFLFPFGEPDLSDPVGEFLPAWMRRLKNSSDQLRSPEEQRIFASTVGHVLDWMVMNGEIDTSDPVALREGVERATDRAKKVYAYRALAQMALPSSPSPRWLVKDKTGTLVSATLLRKEAQELMREDPNTAMPKFLNKYGELAYIAFQPFSQSLIYEAPVTKPGLEWAQTNPDVVKALPNTYGFFAPVSENVEDFDFTAYAAQFNKGERVSLSGDQILMAANNRHAREIYQQARDRVGPSPTVEQRAVLRQLQDRLMSDFPGYNPGLGGVAGIPKRATLEQVVSELQRAVKVPEVLETSQGQGLQVFLEAWEFAEKRAQAMGFADHTRAKNAAPLRAVLRGLAGQLGQDFDGFTALYDQVFDRVMNDDLDQINAEAA